MDIVVGHSNLDFDALASQVAITKLFPGTLRVSIGSVLPIVRDFLALHKEHFELIPLSEVDLEQVERLFLVDVRRESRLRVLEPLLCRLHTGTPPLELHIYDHHESASDNLECSDMHVASVGAITTLLVEQMRERKIFINPLEATLFALGIYSDTGSLTYSGTTPRDVNAAAYLLSLGASLQTLRYFLHSPLSRIQRKVLVEILEQPQTIDMHGIKIGLASLALEEYVAGLSEVTSVAMTLRGFEALFALFAVGHRITIIGRSQVPYIDIGNILQELGGGGHRGAGAASLKNATLQQTKQQLMDQLELCPPKPNLVRHLMSTPVHTVLSDHTLQEVHDYFKRDNISGAPVLSDGKIVGVISKRDLRKAKKSSRMHLPVSSCMSQRLVTIDPEAPLIRALEQMVEADVGRLPVMEDGNLVGILTRTDALRILYPTGDVPKGMSSKKLSARTPTKRKS